MLTYNNLAIKYLMINKRRSVFTIVGVAIVSAFLFIVLNGIINLSLQLRDRSIREEGDYQIVFYEMSEETMEKMVNDPRIVSAYVGTEYDYYAEIEYPNALHIKVSNPYIMTSTLKSLEKEYGVEGELNDAVTWTYLQGGDNAWYLIILVIIFFVYIYSVIGVGVIKNSIELSNMEQIRDYGNLRCIGATKKEIEKIIFREGILLEGAGIILGVVVGYPLYIVAALNVSFTEIFNDTTTKLSLSFHILPVILIVLAFMFDLFFTMKDSAKHIAKISPVSAIKGEYRIKVGKIKKRHSGIFGLLFGVEGDYAYKNAMRNKGRFVKTVAAMSIGLAAVAYFGGYVQMVAEYAKDAFLASGYYRMGLYADNMPTYTCEDIKAAMPSADTLKKIASSDEVLGSKPVYTSFVYMAEDYWMADHLADEAKTSSNGEWYIKEKELLEKSGGVPSFTSLSELKTTDKTAGVYDTELTAMSIQGYDSEDYQRLAGNLISGTSELSENGVILVNAGKTLVEVESLWGVAYEHMTYTDLKVGDTITVADPILLKERAQELMQETMEDYEAGVARLTDEEIKRYDEEYEETHTDYYHYESGKNDFYDPHYLPKQYSDRDTLLSKARKELVKEGKTRTFVIEGIADGNPNAMDALQIVVPVERYCEITGFTKDEWNGIDYKMKNHLFLSDETIDNFSDITNNLYTEGWNDGTLPVLNFTGWFVMETMGIIKTVSKLVLLVAFIIFTVVAINCINIANVSAAGLHMRRKEFAQLKAMGMTDRGLIKSVLLEGIIALIFSALIGIPAGLIILYVTYKQLLILLLYKGFVIPWLSMIIGILISAAVLIGSLYIPLKNMKKSLQSELTLSGE